MNKHRLSGLIQAGLIFLVGLLWLAGMPLTQTFAQTPPPGRPDPPPDVPGAPPGRTKPPQPGGGGGVVGRQGDGGGDHPFNPCMTVYGVVISWGYRNEPKIPVTLNGPGWQTQKWTDDNGHYASDCLGEGLALLNPVSPSWLRPMTTDVAIRAGYRQNFEVNLGVYGGEVAPAPEVRPAVSVSPNSVRPGETVTYTIRVTNTLSARIPMGEVMVTDLLPEALTPVTASSTLGVVEWWGNLLTADIGTLPPGQTVTIVVTGRLRAGSPPVSEISSRVSLLHAGHVTAQSPTITISVSP